MLVTFIYLPVIKSMKKLSLFVTAVSLFLCCTFLWINPAAAKVNGTEVRVSLGTSSGELKFVPNHLEFSTGTTYKLLLNNPSPTKHYFTAKDFADASWTRKVQAGKVEVKGAIHELELKPGGEAEWVFVPEKPGNYELHCSIPGHAEAGMVGQIIISTP